MRVVEPGHIYEVANADGDDEQRIVFVRRRDSDAERLPDDQGHEGILSQELLRVLINRTLYLNDEDPCTEDVEIVHKLRDCLKAYESRAARRSIEKLSMPERTDGCDICHHLLCFHDSGKIEHGIPR